MVSVKLFKVADCPVAPGAEVVVVLLRADSGMPIFYCEDCGCAWESMPDPSRVDGIPGADETA
jgi:hypothetical protein